MRPATGRNREFLTAGSSRGTGWPVSCGGSTRTRRRIPYRTSQCVRLRGRTGLCHGRGKLAQGRCQLCESQRAGPAQRRSAAERAGPLRPGHWQLTRRRAELLAPPRPCSVSAGVCSSHWSQGWLVSWGCACKNPRTVYSHFFLLM